MAGDVVCFWCHKSFERSYRQIEEAEKFGWRQFCSLKCLKQSRLEGKVVICNNPFCGKKFYKKRSQINKTTRNFCSRACSVILHNYERGLRNRKKCSNPNCNNLRKNRSRYCSRRCFFAVHKDIQKVHRNSRKPWLYIPTNKISKAQYAARVIPAIRAFVNQNKRVPFKIEMQKYYRSARIAFGTWNKAIKAAGFNPNQLKFTHKYLANDKHICDSLAEKIIDDWLFARKIKHERSVYYPNQKKFKTDFKVGDYWIEFFGLEGQLKRYDELKKRKLDLIRKSKLKLIKILPKELFPCSHLDNKLSFLVD